MGKNAHEGSLFCREHTRKLPLKARSSTRWCACGHKIRGNGHYEGRHHRIWERKHEKVS